MFAIQNIVWDKYHLCGVLARNTSPGSNYGISAHLKLRGFLQKNWPVLCKTVKVKKDKNSRPTVPDYMGLRRHSNGCNV